MQSHKILINQFYAKTGQTAVSELVLDNDYYAYDLEVNGGGVVNEFNVRAFLNDSRNEQIINDFFSYLTGSTSIYEFREIYYSDKKLSSVFNQYYNQSVLSGLSVTTSVINENLVNTIPTIIYDFTHQWDGIAVYIMSGIPQSINGGTMLTTATPEMDTFTTEESYYVPVFIERTTEQLSRNIFDVCSDVVNKNLYDQFTSYSGISTVPNSFIPPILLSSSLTTVLSSSLLNPNITYFDGATTTNHGLIPFDNVTSYYCATTTFSNFIKSGATSSRITNLLDCFVNMNLETNENLDWVFNPIPVSFTSSTYYSEEGKSVLIALGLHYISEKGFEEVTVNAIPTPYVTPSDYSTSIPLPTTFSWSAGEQYKYFTVNINNDYEEEYAETIDLQFTNYVNTIPGALTSTKIVFNDKTDLATVGMSGLSMQQNVPITIQGSNNTTFTFNANNVVSLQEGSVYTVDIFLSKPAIGIETVDLVINNGFVNSASTFFDYNVSPVIPASTNKVTISFASGQTQTSYTFTITPDMIPEQTEYISLSLTNNQFCHLNTSLFGITIQIIDSNPQSRFVAFNIPQFFIGFGNNSYAPAELRHSLLGTNNLGDATFCQYNMALKYGSTVRGNHVNFTATPNRTPVNYSYDLFQWGSPGDLIFYAKNNTPNTAFYGNTIVAPGQTITLDVFDAFTGSGFTIVLPTNINLDVPSNKFMDAQWDISFYVRYAENMFTLRESDNSTAVGGVFNLGPMTFISGFTTQSQALEPQNTWFLTTSYSSMTTGRHIYPSYSTTLVCPLYTLDGYDWNTTSAQEKAKIRGIYFLSHVSQTKYMSFGLMKNYNIFPTTCGSSNRSNTYYTSPPSWTSIPFSGLP